MLADPAHRDVARVAAERSAVLLRNEGDLLPLDASALDTAAVIGPLADSPRDTLGPWVFDFDLDETVTVLAGICARVSDRVRVEYARGIPVVQRAFPSLFDMFGRNTPTDPEGFDADAEFRRAWTSRRAPTWRSSWRASGRHDRRDGLPVLGGAPRTSARADPGGRGDRHSGRPAGDERAAVDLRWAAANVPAILDIWYPGTHGGAAVANLLFGDVAPGGTLPFTWPRTVGQVPMIYSRSGTA